MKNLFLVLSFILISVSTYSQDDFSGWWQSKTSKYITMIYAGSYGVSAVVNYSPSTDNTIHEEIIKRNKKTFVTRLFNPANGYFVKVKYKLKDKNNLICKFSGDLNKTIHLTRYEVNLKDKLKK
jgi:hypothetical protein